MSYNQKEQFSAIAEAIRGKDGTTDTIAAKDFAARIAAIPVDKVTIFTTTEITKNIYGPTVTGLIGKDNFVMFLNAGTKNAQSKRTEFVAKIGDYTSVGVCGQGVNPTFTFNSATGTFSCPSEDGSSYPFAYTTWRVITW